MMVYNVQSPQNHWLILGYPDLRKPLYSALYIVVNQLFWLKQSWYPRNMRSTVLTQLFWHSSVPPTEINAGESSVVESPVVKHCKTPMTLPQPLKPSWENPPSGIGLDQQHRCRCESWTAPMTGAITCHHWGSSWRVAFYWMKVQIICFSACFVEVPCFQNHTKFCYLGTLVIGVYHLQPTK